MAKLDKISNTVIIWMLYLIAYLWGFLLGIYLFKLALFIAKI